MNYVNGESIGARGIDSCRDSARPGLWHDELFGAASETQQYFFYAAAPTSRAAAISLNLTSTSSLRLTFSGPGGLLLQLKDGALQYFSSAARAGLYTLKISGPISTYGMDCGVRQSVMTFTSVWTGTLNYTPLTLSANNMSAKARSYPRPCVRIKRQANFYAC